LARLHSTEDGAPEIVLKTWAEIHGFFRKLLPRMPEPAALLVRQFVEYLEYSEMSGFTGFRQDHFEYFLSHDDDDARRWVRDQFADLAGRVQRELRAFSSFYTAFDVGVLKSADACCWAAFGPDRRKYRRVTHQTISLSSDGLQVFVNAELKPASERIKRALKRAADTVRAKLADLHAFEPFDLVLEERTRRQVRLYDYTPKLRLHSSLVADETAGDDAWKAFVETFQLVPLPYLRIERLIPPIGLLQLPEDGGAGAIDLLAGILKVNHAVVDLLNG